MKGLYAISGWIMAGITLLIFLVVTINEDISVKLATGIIFPVMVLILSCPCSMISRRLIAKGDTMKSPAKRVLFYACMPLGSLAVFAIILKIGYMVEDTRVSTGDFGTELGRAILFVFFMASVFILILIPHIQTYIVLILRKIMKRKA